MELAEHRARVHCCLQASWHVTGVWSRVLARFFSLQTPRTRFSDCSNKKQNKNTADNLQLCCTAFASLHLLCKFYSSKDEGFERLHGQLYCAQCKKYLPGFIRGKCAYQWSWVLCFSLYCSSPASSPPCFFYKVHTSNESFLHGYMYGWLAKLQALLSNHSRFVCSLWDNVGQLPWRLELGLIFILRVDLWAWTAWKPLGGIFFVTCPWAQNTVFSPNACVRFCINTAD